MKQLMSVVTFDTLVAVRNLEKAGMGTPQAEAVAETIRVAVFQGVASKEDIAELRAEMKADIAELRAEMKADIGELHSEIAALRAENKADIAELRAELEKLRADLMWRMMLIMGGLLAIFTAVDRLFLN